MKQVLIVLHSHDIPPALAMAAELADYTTVVFDPTIVDEVMDSGLRNVEFIEFENCPTFADIHNSSRELALAIERQLYATIEDLLPGLSNFSWLHLNFYYIFHATQWYNALGQFFAPRFRERFGNAIAHVFINDNPAFMYWPSFIPAINFLENLQAGGVEFKGVTYEPRPDETNAVPALIDLEGRTDHWDLVVHVPTCTRDAAFLDGEIAASGKKTLKIASKYWDIELDNARELGLTNTDILMLRLSPSLKAHLEAIVARLATAIDIVLTPHVRSPAYRERQTQQLASLYRAQLATFFVLPDYFQGRKPKKMLLTDHCATFHGPLLAYAEQRNIPVLLFPHSKTTADMQFDRANIVCLTHPIQGAPVNDALNRPAHTRKLLYPEFYESATLCPAPLKRIGLLLNSISLNGVYVTRYQPYMDGIRAIAQWCEARGIELVIRGRPGFPLFRALEEATGVSVDEQLTCLANPLGNFVADQQVCLMYDAPTTAEIDFLRNGVPILNPIPEPLAKYEAVIANPDVVPRMAVEEALFLLDSFIADPVALQLFKIRQFASYTASFKDAVALRSVL